MIAYWRRYGIGTLVIALLAGLAGWTAPAQETPPAEDPPADGFRRPRQVAELEHLIREREARTILPEGSDAPGSGGPGELLPEGSTIWERVGRVVRGPEHTEFEFLTADGSRRAMKLLPSQLREFMENESDRGPAEFVLTAEVLRYRGENYLLARKAIRRMSNGNLGPPQ